MSQRLSRALPLVALLAVLVAFAVAALLSGTATAPLASPAPASVPPGELNTLRSRLLAAQESKEIKDIAVDEVVAKGDWTLVTMHPLTGLDEGVEGILAIGKFEGGRWRFAVQGEGLFAEWLELLPAELMTEEEKAWFR